MKYNRIRVLIALIVGCSVQGWSLNAGMFELKTLLAPDNGSVEKVASVVKQIEVLEEAERTLREQAETATTDLDKISSELAAIKGQASAPTDQVEFLNKKLAIVSRTYQVATEIVQALRTMIGVAEKHRTALQSFQEDPTFEGLQQPIKASPGFEDLQKSAQRLFTHKSLLDEYITSKQGLVSDQDKRKRALDAVSKEYEEKKQQQQNFKQNIKEGDVASEFTRHQRGEIIDEELRELLFKKRLAELKFNEDSMRIAFFDTRIAIAQRQVELLQKEYAQVKRALTIESSYVKSAEDKIEKKRQQLFAQREKLNKNIHLLLPLREQYKNNIKDFVKKFELSPNDVAAIKSWSKEAEALKTVNDWQAYALVSAANAQENLIETQVELLQAQINQANIDFRAEDREVEILRSWYRMTQQQFRFNAEEELDQEVEKYKTERSQLKADLAELYEKRDNVINLLSHLNIARDKVKALVGILGSKKTVLFAQKPQDYQKTLQGFMKADDEIRKRINFIGKLLEVYAKSIAKVRSGIKKIEDIIEELSGKSFWMRSDQSIEWEDLQNFVPDIQRFVVDIQATGFTYLQSIDIRAFLNGMLDYLKVPYLLVLLILRLLIALVVYVLLRIYLPDLRSYLMQGESRYRFLSKIRAFFGLILDFLISHLAGLYVWSLAYIVVSFDFIDYYISIWFYLISCVYLFYIAYRFFQYLVVVNKNRGYIFIGQSYLHRFLWVVPTLVYATILISFFRQAFMQGNYYGSPVPDILLAINFILLQIALISLIGKEQVLSIFAGRTTPAAQWMEEKIENYYYVFLLVFIAVIVMSNPYVGYGRQVFYVFSRLLITALLIPVFSWLHNRIKRASSDFFFYYSDGSAVKERFPAGKTWYGLFVVVSFFFFVLLGLVIGARIWGQGITLYDVTRWFNYTLYSPGLDEVTGKPVLVTPLSLIKIVGYLAGGFAVAYIANRFVLRRIFDPLLIGSGVQNTILTLSRYILIVVALMIGLQSAGLEGMATKLAVVLAALGFAIREPVADFISYFIILVQRPIKVGDLIQIEPDVFGVVRHITPRATIVRHKNSLTLVVPNSKVITSTIRNWHYSRTFGAFRDIEITVPYTIDPDRAREIMFEVLEANNNILKNPTPVVWLIDFAEYGFKFSVRGFISADKVIDLFDIESEVRLDLVRRFRKEGIAIAVPVRILQMKEGDKIEAKKEATVSQTSLEYGEGNNTTKKTNNE